MKNYGSSFGIRSSVFFEESMIEAKADYDRNKEQDISIMVLILGLNKSQIVEGINNVKLGFEL